MAKIVKKTTPTSPTNKPAGESDVSWPAVILGVGVLAGGLFLLYRGKGGTAIEVVFQVEHFGPAENLAVGVQFGNWNGVWFNQNQDLVFCELWPVEEHSEWTLIEASIEVLIPPKESAGWKLPQQYDAEFTIRTECPGQIYGPTDEEWGNTRIVTEGVFTHTEDFQVLI